jgi:enoyl-CoA hydratase
MAYKTLKYSVAGRIARITLNRPARLNAIDDRMPREIRRAVKWRDSGKAIPRGKAAA